MVELVVRWSYKLYLTVYLLVFAHTAMAAQKATSAISSGQLLQVVIVTFLFVLVIVAISFFLKKMNFSSRSKSAAVRVVTSVPIGVKQRISLIEIGGRQILLGITPGQINTLHVFDQPIIEEEKAVTQKNFMAYLKQAIKQG